ncbi:MAG: DegV family protein [Anaerolineales bacterium]
MPKIALITDSTAYIPQELIQQYNITVLPQQLIWGNETFFDGVDILPITFYQRLQTSKEMPTTSQVSPGAFKQAYEKLLAQGNEVLAILISSKLSGTLDSARQAKALLGDYPIHLYDSQTSAMALGFQVLAAARAIEQGATIQDCLQLLERVSPNTGVLLSPETLEYLHRGGRIGGATRFLGTALGIKPLLHVENGRVEPLERVRTRRKALQRLAELVTERANGKPVRIAALHANAIEEARATLADIQSRNNVIESIVSDVSPVIGTHVGPGTVAISYMIEN